MSDRQARPRTCTHRVADVITGDARQLASLVMASGDLSLTSLPYMTATGHPENPLTSYTTMDGDYQTYLREIEGVFADVVSLLRPGDYAAIDVANVVSDAVITSLALRRCSRSFICWDRLPPVWPSAAEASKSATAQPMTRREADIDHPDRQRAGFPPDDLSE
jgi:hypothetical protein